MRQPLQSVFSCQNMSTLQQQFLHTKPIATVIPMHASASGWCSLCAHVLCLCVQENMQVRDNQLVYKSYFAPPILRSPANIVANARAHGVVAVKHTRHAAIILPSPSTPFYSNHVAIPPSPPLAILTLPPHAPPPPPTHTPAHNSCTTMS